MSIFTNILVKKPRRNAFDLSHEKKLTCNMGDLIPIVLEEVVPGDTFKINSEILMRMQPMLAPIMHRVNVYTHYFFVPNRIIWEDWEEFITGGEDGLSELTLPQLSIEDGTKQWYVKGRLGDYFGIPPVDQEITVENTIILNRLPFLAYQKIYNDYYRDQNLEEEIEGTTSAILTTIRKRAWEKDYFTSALPWAQRGGEVELPIVGTAPVQATADVVDGSEIQTWYTQNPQGTQPVEFVESNDEQGFLRAGSGAGSVMYLNDGLEADLSEATAITINDLRRATKLQQWLEANARGGSRYIEQIFHHFGVKSSDARLQRPEYLGGGKFNMTISEVLSKVATEDAPQGDMTGHGISYGKNNRISKYFEEHGFIIGLMSVLPRTTYQNGIHKTFLRQDKLDFYWPEFAQLGEQEVNQKEIFVDYQTEGGGLNDETFGYQSRYAEYKHKSSEVCGDMRDNLSFWHMGRIYTGPPVLNKEFVQSDPTHRIFAVSDPSIDKLIVQVYNNIKAIRPMPYFNVPSL